MAAVRVPVALVEAPRGELPRLAAGLDDSLHARLMQVPAQEQVHVGGDEAAGRSLVGQVRQRVVYERALLESIHLSWLRLPRGALVGLPTFGLDIGRGVE